MANIVMFCILAAVILFSAVMCVVTTRIMRAATFLLFVLFGVAGIYFLLDYTFLGAAQVSIYAGGVTMIYIFAIQLMSKRSLQGMVEKLSLGRIAKGALLSVVGLLTVTIVFIKNIFLTRACEVADTEVPMDTIGTALLGSEKYQYVLPFEFISVFLLACIIGGIIVARKEENK